MIVLMKRQLADISEKTMRPAVFRNSREYDGKFYYAAKTTGLCCRSDTDDSYTDYNSAEKMKKLIDQYFTHKDECREADRQLWVSSGCLSASLKKYKFPR